MRPVPVYRSVWVTGMVIASCFMDGLFSEARAIELSDLEDGRGGFVLSWIEPGAHAGQAVAGVRDLNGDGFGEVMVGVPDSGEGIAIVVYGSSAPESINLTEVMNGDAAGFWVLGAAVGDFLGSYLSGTGDINGDGVADLVIAATRRDPGGRSNAGAAYVIFGADYAVGGMIDVLLVESGLIGGGFVMYGEAPNDIAGIDASDAGDVNGDGLDDVVLGAIGADPGGRTDAGAGYVVFGRTSSTPVELSDIAAGVGGFKMNGRAAGDRAGTSIAGAGDVNGDNLDDVVICSWVADPGGRTDAGECYVVFGKTTTETVELSDVAAGNGGFRIEGALAADGVGVSACGAGDVNGDGLGDVALAAPQADPLGRFVAGAAYIVFGKVDTAPVFLSNFITNDRGILIQGARAGDTVGEVSGAGDLNGDGYSDLLVGAERADPGGRMFAGESYVVFGQPLAGIVDLLDNGVVIAGIDPDDASGQSLSLAGDVNGDNVPDLVIGAYMADQGIFQATGEAYVVTRLLPLNWEYVFQAFLAITVLGFVRSRMAR